ncbi:uncharacterized protein IUM83_19468 [Phytophthora cinnamomi]|uniref:uncharacterized protein n=1 Tax=Phytophthora cinnamomi TaxID=4785 RepID=UPI003559D7CE|nr:hypothetical protein IUM83_19468 [Phytophthora cinnamomi]
MGLWDDRTNFLDNRVLRDPLSLETLYAMFTMVRLNVYEPLGWMLKLAIVKAVGLDAWWVRLVSIVVHFAAGFVLAKVSAAVLDVDYLMSELQGPGGRTGLELQKRKERSSLHWHACCMSAVTFMAHPVHVEITEALFYSSDAKLIEAYLGELTNIYQQTDRVFHSCASSIAPLGGFNSVVKDNGDVEFFEIADVQHLLFGYQSVCEIAWGGI